MIDRNLLTDFVEKQLEGTPLFVVDVTVTPDNRLTVEIDSREGGVDIDRCVELTRAIEAEFDRDREDYELEVGSAGLTSPFKVKAQYDKNVGNQVEVLTADGRKLKGTLTAASDDDFTVEVATKVKREGEKRPAVEQVPHTLKYNEVKYTKYLLDF